MTLDRKPISAELLASISKLTAAAKILIQLSENLCYIAEVQRSLDLDASNYFLPDVVKIKVATQLLRVAKICF